MWAKSVFVPQGDAAAKMGLLRGLVENAKRDPSFHRLVLSIPREYAIPEYDWQGELSAVKDWVHRHVRYTRDPWGLETFRRPQETIALGAGDCDDLTSLGIAIVETLGYSTRADIIRGPKSRTWSHIKFDAGVPPGKLADYWVPMELTMRGWPVGRDAPASIVAERVYFDANGKTTRVRPALPPKIIQGIGGGRALKR